MSEEPISACPPTREVDFAWFLRTVTESDTTTCTLSAKADSVRLAREVTRTTLRRWGMSDLSDDAVLIASELVTNAIRYARYPAADWADRPIMLTLLRSASHVVLAVSDPSEHVPIPRRPDIVSEHGRGLYLVESFSQSWGWHALDDGGKTVWALLRSGG